MKLSWNSLLTLFQRNKVSIKINDVVNSDVEVNVIDKLTIVNREEFEVSIIWFDKLINLYYDDEIKTKYIPELHQNNSFEREHLDDILNFDSKKVNFTNQIRVCLDYVQRYYNSYNDFYQYLKAEDINIIDIEYPFIIRANELFNKLNAFKEYLKLLENLFECKGYEILKYRNKIVSINHGIPNAISFNKKDWNLLLDKKPEEHILRYLFQHHNQIYYELNGLNTMLNRFAVNINYKIIVGSAGTGKSHISAHLIRKIEENNDLVIFLKSKSFNGDNINFDERLLQLLQIPKGYTLNEILEKINSFAYGNNKRCFIIIDALNETTKSNIGFSDIWKINLQSFINQIKTHSNLYIVCTLRTSYIESIWDTEPSNVKVLKGFDDKNDLIDACEKYFKYYRIVALNFDTADLRSFANPLLLDLYCKFLNEDRNEDKKVNLNINSYLEIFENYIIELTKEVKEKLHLQMEKPIRDGINESSDKFFNVNEAQISIDDFSSSFDKDLLVTTDKSIARSILEGYLIFIRDSIAKNKEIVRHTQQEIGGYLLAKKLSNDNDDITILVNSQLFIDKIVGADTSKHHQLRLDILKFIIALRPEIIELLNDVDSLKLSWWYLFNGNNFETNKEITPNLRKSLYDDNIFDNLLEVSSNNWFNSDVKLNFNYISEILNEYNLWDFDLKWTYFIYRKADELDSFIDESISELDNQSSIILEKEIIIAKFISRILSTTVRELRDKATLYIINFGKLYPLELLELTIEASQYKDIYIYERLTSCCYGVLLIRQNDKDYLEYFLPRIADELFKLQFSENPTASKYNYIVIDSIKHIIDFAILNDLISLSKKQKLKISNYEFIPPNDWIPPSEEQINLINGSHETSWPDPIGMDFGIYTIPRLIKRDDVDYNRRFAIANVYKRIFELGYENLDLSNFNNELFKEFIWGYDIYGIKGKVDKLEKKYCWISFFDFAGYLLLNKALNVFDKNGTGINSYQRLGDVDIDISLPNKDYDEKLKLYHYDLLERKNIDSKWYDENKIDTIKDLFETNLGTDDFTMLYGFVEQRVSDDYKVRSFLMVETMFIDKNENLKK